MSGAELDVTWRSALLLAVVAPTVLVALRLLFHSTETVACRWLALFLLAFCIDVVPQIIGFAGAYSVWPGLTFAPFNLQFFFGPLIYLHAHTLMRKTRPGWRWWLLAPGVIQFLYYCIAFTTLGDYKAKWAYNNAFHEPVLVPIQLFVALALAVGGGIATVRLVRRYRHYVRQTQSIARDIDPSWLARCLAALGAAITLWIGFEVIDAAFGPLGYTGRYPMFVIIGLVLLWMGVEALARIRVPFVALGSFADEPAALESAQASAQPASAGLDKDWAQIGAALRQQMVNGRWHLEPRFSLRDLARRVGSNESYVSRAINRGLARNFNQMVNEARVESAQAIFVDQPEARVIDVAHGSGFNAKATFNRVFRDMTGVTPSAWRRDALSREVSNSVNH